MAPSPLNRARKFEQDALVRQVLGQAIERLDGLAAENEVP